MALFPGLPGWVGTRKVKPIWILLKQETVSGSGISWAICKSAPGSRQITTPAPHHSVFYRLDALPAALGIKIDLVILIGYFMQLYISMLKLGYHKYCSFYKYICIASI